MRLTRFYFSITSGIISNLLNEGFLCLALIGRIGLPANGDAVPCTTVFASGDIPFNPGAMNIYIKMHEYIILI